MAIAEPQENLALKALVQRSTITKSINQWQAEYSRRLLFSDTLVVALSLVAAHALRYGTQPTDITFGFGSAGQVSVNYWWVSLLIAGVWLVSLAISGTRDYRVSGTGTEEYREVVSTSFRVFGGIAIISYLFKLELGRGYFLLLLPIGVTALLLSRWLWRKWLLKQRSHGKYVHRALVLGNVQKNSNVIKQILGEPNAGYEIVGAVSDFKNDDATQVANMGHNFPWMDSSNDILHVIDSLKPDTVIYTTSDSFTPDRLRRLGWRLEERGMNFVVAPALTDVAGPRIHTRPVAGLPLIHVEYPEFHGTKYWLKRAFDLIVTTALVIVASPLLLLVAIAIKADSRGPVIFRQERVGINGENFNMLKFRSMRIDAEELLQSLLEQTDGNGVLFKMKDDPRITPVGKFIRKYSIDELPQLFNVLKGEMSLVGPRPPLEREVELYDEWDGRRLLVKPGITGLWQVSGRSDLSWEDSIRLDLYYVENWSLLGDCQILYRTIRTVVHPNGAY